MLRVFFSSVLRGGLLALVCLGVVSTARAQDPPLLVENLDPTVQPGDTVEVQVNIGTEANPVPELVGVGFQLDYASSALDFIDHRDGALFAEALQQNAALDFLAQDADSVNYSVTFTTAAPLADTLGETVRFRFQVADDAVPGDYAFVLSDAERSSSTSSSIPITTLRGDTVTVATDNAPPSGSDDRYATDEDQALTVAAPGVLDNDSDPDGDALEVAPAPIQAPTDGSLTLQTDGAFEYVPDANFYGTDAFTYEVRDGNGGTAQATVTMSVEAVNDPPVATTTLPDDTLEAGSVPLEVVGLATTLFRDPDGDPLSVSATSTDPSVLSVERGEDGLALRPQSPGTARVTVTASDGTADTDADPFDVTVVESDADGPAERTAAVVDTSSSGSTVDFGETGARITVREVQKSGVLTVRFFSGSDGTTAQARATTDAAYEHVSPYRWEIDGGGAVMGSADVAFRLADEDVRGVGDPSTVAILVDSTGEGTMESVPTTVDDGGTPDDGTDDVVVADGLSALGTFKLASNDAGNPLPVELVEFAAALDGTDAVLRWRTASETDNAGFQVQHQPPNRSRFTDEGFVDGAGTTTAPQTYRYRVSDLVPGRHRFRLEQVDADGATHRSNPVSVTVETRSLALEVVGPLPVRQSTQVAFTLKQSGPATVALYNVLGERVSVFYDETASAGSRHTVEISTDGLPSGIYFVRLVAPTGSRTSKVTVVR